MKGRRVAADGVASGCSWIHSSSLLAEHRDARPSQVAGRAMLTTSIAGAVGKRKLHVGIVVRLPPGDHGGSSAESSVTSRR